jgi:two-component system cell cycle response regulator DivK
MSGARILIVEDNPRSRKLFRDVLGYHGYAVQEADSGEAALALVADAPPALIVMDIQLPGIDGVETLRRLRAETRTRVVPVLAVTASVMGTDIERIRAAGFDAYLQKPVALKAFLAQVAALLAPPAPSA